MSSIEKNKVVEYGGLALGIGLLLMCIVFYPACAVVSYFDDILPDCVVYNNDDASLNCLIVWQVMGGSVLVGVLWGMWELYFETKEKIILIILIVIYLVTLPTALDLLKSCYEDSGEGGRFESYYVYDGD